MSVAKSAKWHFLFKTLIMSVTYRHQGKMQDDSRYCIYDYDGSLGGPYWSWIPKNYKEGIILHPHTKIEKDLGNKYMIVTDMW